MCQPREAARLRDTSVPQDASYAHRLTVFSPLVMLSSWNNLEGERPEPLPHSQVGSKTTEKEAERSGFSSALAQVAAVAPRPALTARASRHLVTSAEAGVCSSSPGSSLLSPHPAIASTDAALRGSCSQLPLQKRFDLSACHLPARSALWAEVLEPGHLKGYH